MIALPLNTEIFDNYRDSVLLNVVASLAFASQPFVAASSSSADLAFASLIFSSAFVPGAVFPVALVAIRAVVDVAGPRLSWVDEVERHRDSAGGSKEWPCCDNTGVALPHRSGRTIGRYNEDCSRYPICSIRNTA